MMSEMKWYLPDWGAQNIIISFAAMVICTILAGSPAIGAIVAILSLILLTMYRSVK